MPGILVLTPGIFALTTGILVLTPGIFALIPCKLALTPGIDALTPGKLEFGSNAGLTGTPGTPTLVVWLLINLINCLLGSFSHIG